MKRTIGIERVFKLGEYKSLRVIDTVIDVPDEIALDEELVDCLRMILLTDADITYQRYYALTTDTAQYHDGSLEKTNALMEIRANTLDELVNRLEKGKGE